MVLNRLSKRQGAELVEAVTGGSRCRPRSWTSGGQDRWGAAVRRGAHRMVMESGSCASRTAATCWMAPAAAGDPGDPARQPNGPARSARPGEGGRPGRRRHRPDVRHISSGGGPHALRRGPARRARTADGRQPDVPPGAGHRRDHCSSTPSSGTLPMAACSRASASASMPALRLCWKTSSRREAAAHPRSSRSTTRGWPR